MEDGDAKADDGVHDKGKDFADGSVEGTRIFREGLVRRGGREEGAHDGSDYRDGCDLGFWLMAGGRWRVEGGRGGIVSGDSCGVNNREVSGMPIDAPIADEERLERRRKVRGEDGPVLNNVSATLR